MLHCKVESSKKLFQFFHLVLYKLNKRDNVLISEVDFELSHLVRLTLLI